MYREPRLAASYRVLGCVSVLFNLFVFLSLFFDLVGKVRDGEAGVNASAILLKCVINKLVLLLKITQLKKIQPTQIITIQEEVFWHIVKILFCNMSLFSHKNMKTRMKLLHKFN